MGETIQVRRGPHSRLPELANGEIALTTDTKDVYIGTPEGNELIGGKSISSSLAQITTNVKSFGAKGDGITDDTIAIQNAINSVTEHGNVYFPPGTYVISSALTIPTDYVTMQGKAKILAKANTSFETLLSVNGKTGIIIKEIEFDANQLNRVSVQDIRFCGIILASCVDATIKDCIVRNTLGFNSIPAVGIGVAVGTRNTVDGCRFIDCGGTDGTNASDGVYTFGNQTVISNCVAIRCTDTAFVLEASNNSIITGCTALECSVGAGITNFTVDDKYGNIINGLVIRNWKALNNGAIQVGVIGSSTGHVVDSIITNVNITADKASGYGVGPAIRVRSDGFGRVKGLTISNCLIDGATLSGIEVVGDVVSIIGTRIKNVGDSCITVSNGFEHYVSSCYLHGGTFGLTTTSDAEVVAQGNVMQANTLWGIYAFDTSIIHSTMNNVLGGGIGNAGKDLGATLNLVGQIANGLTINNNTTNPTTGTVVDKFGIYDKNGNVLGYVPIYNS